MSIAIHIGLALLAGLTAGTIISISNVKDTQSNTVNSKDNQFKGQQVLKAQHAYLPKPSKNRKLKPLTPHQKLNSYKSFYSWLKKKFHSSHLSITNTSEEEKTIVLWGANKGISISPPAPADVEDHQVIKTVGIPQDIGVGIHPQGIEVNPFNGFAYVANQLSNNVSVITHEGTLIKLIQLEPSFFPGANSPVALAAITDNNNASYGNVYVAGSVANTISVIDISLEIIKEIEAGIRPVAIAYNPVNAMLYVANLVSNTVSVIDTGLDQVIETLPVNISPVGIGINPMNGDVYVAGAGENTVIVYDSNNQLVATIDNVGIKPVSFAYHPAGNKMYVVATGSGQVIPINTENYTKEAPIAVGNSPHGIIYNGNNEFIYVANREDETITVINSGGEIEATISVGDVNIGLAINQDKNVLFTSVTDQNLVNLIGYADQSNSIKVSENLYQKAEYFKHNPALVKHVKFVLSGEKRFKVLMHRRETVTGSKNSTPISFYNHKHPQNLINMAEVFELEGSIIDGLNSWIFTIAGKQTITIIIFYKPIKLKIP